MSNAAISSAKELLANRHNIFYFGPDSDVLLETIAREHQLVVDLHSQVVYWNGVRYYPDFTSATWSLFEKLILVARQTGGNVDRLNISGRREISEVGLRTRKSRLCRILFECKLTELADRIISVGYGYRLKIPSSEIYLHSDLHTQLGVHHC